MASPTTSTGSNDSSLASSERASLNDADHTPIVVYHHRHGIYLSSQHDLLQKLNKDRSLRVAKKPIPWGNSSMEVQQGDLFPERERRSYERWPNMRASLAAVSLPPPVRWKRMLLGRFRELYIVSPDASPQSSPEASQNVSPQDTFRRAETDASVAEAHGGADAVVVAPRDC